MHILFKTRNILTGIVRHFSVKTNFSHKNLFKNAVQVGNKIAIVDNKGQFTYNNILTYSKALSYQITNILGNNSNGSKQISILCPNEVTYVIAQWATWLTGNVSVPLYKDHPESFFEYYIKDSQSSLVLTTEEYLPKIRNVIESVNIPHILMDYPTNTEDILDKSSLNILSMIDLCKVKNKQALMIYTSGTTGSPKGVVLTHQNLHYQIGALVDAWEWEEKDVILNALPLHHMHGIMNALLCPLTVGATCVLLPKFDSEKVWEHLLNTNTTPRVNLFMGVPTMYAKLIEYYNNKYSDSPRTQKLIREICKHDMRLMVCGSASLPDPIMKKWEKMTGHTLLERYGMSEIGMALSNPLHGKRLAGTVGTPLPNVEARITSSDAYSNQGYNLLVYSGPDGTRVESKKEMVGDLQIRGPTVFLEYYNRPQATAEAFTEDRWFHTGDVAEYCTDTKHFRILGRSSADIIKSGGYKISALDVERILLSHPKILECVVVGLPDPTWNEKVAAIVVLRKSEQLGLQELRMWCKDMMPFYYTPSVVECVQEIQRNALGKVNKKDLAKQLFPDIFNKFAQP